MSLNPLRGIPSVNELLEYPRLRKLVERISPGVVVSGVRAVLEEVRSEVQTAATELTLPSLSELAERIARRVLETGHAGLVPVINATGVLLHPELGGPPLAPEAIAEMAAVAGQFAGSSLDPAAERHRRWGQAAEALLVEITGAEDALVTSNKAAATVLAVAALAAGREVIISRGDLVAADPRCRVADLIIAAGAVIREVGAANLTRLDDYRKATGARSAALMRVHPSRSAVIGLAESASLEELVELGRRHGLPVLNDVGIGGLVRLDGFGPDDQPSAAESLRSGADLVILSGDQLLGGPACGIVLGSRRLVRAMAEHPAREAFAVDRLTLPALRATLALWQEPEKARRAIPLLGLLGTSVDNLGNRASRLAPQIAATAAVAAAEPEQATAYLAGEAIPSHGLPTWRIAVTPSAIAPERMAAALRAGSTAVVAGWDDKRLVVDLRSVFPRQDQQLVEAFDALVES